MKHKTIFLIDANSFCYRAFYAIRDLATSKGEPTNAIYGFLNMLRKIMNEQKPDYVAVAFDLPGPTFRHKRYEEYKIQRKPMPEGLRAQIPKIKELLKAYHIAIFEKQGFEADDILATIAENLKTKALDIYIATGDKDMLQLVDDKIKAFSLHKEGEIIDKEKIKERFGVDPSQIIDYIALCGDTSDNIPGVRGIGDKTASKLLSQFKDIDSIYKNLEKVESESLRHMLAESKDDAYLSRELAVVDAKVPLDIKLEDMQIKQPDTKKLVELFRDFEFRALLKEIAPAHAEVSGENITGKKNLDKLIKEISTGKKFSFYADRDTRMSICAPSGKVYSLPEELISGIGQLFEDAKIQKISHDIKSQKIILFKKNIDICEPYFDIKLASYLLSPQRSNHELEDIALGYLGQDAGESAESRAHVSMQLFEVLNENLKEKDMMELFYDIEMPLVSVLASMERAGVSLDTQYLKKLSCEMDEKLKRIACEIYDIAGCDFNINSPKQLSVVLFEKLKLPVVKKGKTGPSTDVEVLETLASKHALPAAILKYREYSKLKSTYVDALPALVNPDTQRVHTSFNQTVTATGRLSSSEPNLQNIPIRTKEGQRIRKAFIPRDKDSVLLSADYSQIELRILAHVSGDTVLSEAFNKNTDIHTYTASLIFGVKENQVTTQQRDIAKTVNFGIVYGMSAYGLSKELNIDTAQAGQFIDSYFLRYPKVKEYLNAQIEHARGKGYVMTLSRRRRYIPDISSENQNIRSFAERSAINMPVQGSAADLIKVAMVNIYRELSAAGLKSKMILQVHDELVFEAQKSELDAVARLVKEKMENAMKLSVPVRVKISAGKNWLEMEEIK
ncbi:MAG: DNA polymerase I [Candidatus Omnitrophota bacterium]